MKEHHYRATLHQHGARKTTSACRSGHSASSSRRRASRAAFPRGSVGNDNPDYRAEILCRYADLNYRATLCVVMPFRTLRVLFATQSV
ncbi:hypothetical protein E2N90_17355 [Pseudomonas syringae pv. tomato]|nr:hypothetical protein EIZ61_03980 [Pseudomonas syringae]TES54085.1 hypothetical protein E2N91_24435 [Pseudomonas syringae pv. tomato]TES66082.1 hypothetical protein E2N90_17355 [Pseudomonas syringae pv. tomato]TES80118.1 hypothetical protein E2N89_02975 [Pseudomonas syringae pv. tomato]